MDDVLRALESSSMPLDDHDRVDRRPGIYRFSQPGRWLYVGSSNDMGRSVGDHMSGAGSADLYDYILANRGRMRISWKRLHLPPAETSKIADALVEEYLPRFNDNGLARWGL
ncbi:MAG: hypothetical protein MPJ78_20520 [Hyphomicrobiaceae bacterium]|nr:hypothetical protein [Hyphomicrobiaceae bacterium]